MTVPQDQTGRERAPNEHIPDGSSASQARETEFDAWVAYMISDQAVADGMVVRHTVSRDCEPHTAAARRYVVHKLDTLPRCQCGYASALRSLALDVLYGRNGRPPLVGFRFFRQALWLNKQVAWDEPDDHVEDEA